MPQFTYRGSDRNGTVRTGERFAVSEDELNNILLKEGISPFEIKKQEDKISALKQLSFLFVSESNKLEDLSIFARQMQLLHHAGVPMVTAIKQIATYTRSTHLAKALNGCIDHLEKGEKLSSAMQHYPDVFSKLIVNIVQIGENTGHLSQAFEHLHGYLEFEAKNRKQLRSSFRYPIFVSVTILFAIFILNLFVIPTFARFYKNIESSLPWQTRFLIGMSDLFVYYGIYLLLGFMILMFGFYRYIKTTDGRYNWDQFLLRMPLLGKLIKRLILIKISQSLAIILNSGVSVLQALVLVGDLVQNSVIRQQINDALQSIQHGYNFTQAIGKIQLFTPLELQIISVGEKNGELGSALSYIGHFHSQEIEFDLKRMNDWIGPILIAAVSILILIVAMGIYLPIWNMINLNQ